MAEPPVMRSPLSERAYSRLKLGIGARLDILGGWQRVRLLDLSQGGAHVVLNRPEPLRDAVLSWLRFDAFGAVVWQEDAHIGMRFDRPLPLAWLVETRQRAPTVVREEAMAEELSVRAWAVGGHIPATRR